MKPVPSVFVSFVLVVVISCGGGAGEGASPGERLYASQGCTACHGAAGEGAMLGPPLRGLAANWSREALVEHLRDPAAAKAKDPRLQQLGSRYSMPMPPVKGLSDEEVGQLADWLLETMR